MFPRVVPRRGLALRNYLRLSRRCDTRRQPSSAVENFRRKCLGGSSASLGFPHDLGAQRGGRRPSRRGGGESCSILWEKSACDEAGSGGQARGSVEGNPSLGYMVGGTCRRCAVELPGGGRRPNWVREEEGKVWSPGTIFTAHTWKRAGRSRTSWKASAAKVPSFGHFGAWGEAFVGTVEGVRRVATTWRVGAHRRWDPEGWAEIRRGSIGLEPGRRGTSWSPRSAIPHRGGETERQTEDTLFDRMLLKREDLLAHSYTEDCPGWQAAWDVPPGTVVVVSRRPSSHLPPSPFAPAVRE